MTIDEREQDERHGRDGGVKQSQSPHPRREAISEERCQSSRGKTFRYLTPSRKIICEDHEVRPHRRDHRSAREDLGRLDRRAALATIGYRAGLRHPGWQLCSWHEG